MFIRLRHRRNLKGVATASASYDVVETVRVDGKPRHRFLLGLGSLKQPHDEHDLMRFWLHAIARMNRSNLDNKQCRNLMHGLVRKGVPTPTAKQCEECSSWLWRRDAFVHLQAFVAGTKPPYRRRPTEE